MAQSLYSGVPMGDFVGADEGERCYSQHKVCPKCRRSICDTAELCQECAAAERAAAREQAGDAERLRVRREREQRYNAARAAGWTAAELCPYRDAGNHDVDPLPTMKEIKRRRVGEMAKRWWEKTGG